MKSRIELTLASTLVLAAGGALGACSDEDDGGSATSDNWPSYGHDVRNTRYNTGETTLGPDNVGDLEKAWTSVETGVSPYGVTSTSAYVDGVVYFADWEGKLHAVNAEDGSSVWSTQLNDQTTGPVAQVNASPFVTKDRVFIGGTNSRLYALDRETGEKLWDPNLEIDEQRSTMFWSSPVIFDDTLLIGQGSFEVFLPANPYSFNGHLIGVDTEAGEVAWRAYVVEEGEERCVGCSIWGSAAIDTERRWAYVGIGQSYSAPASSLSDAVIAVDLDTGEKQWGYQFTADDVFTSLGSPDGPDFDVGASVVLYERDDIDFVGAGDKGGKFYGLDRESGELLWERRLTTGGRTGGVMASPAVADGVIYVVSNDGIEENFGSNGPGASTAFALNGKTGKVIWKTEIDDGVFGGVAIANGLMFFTTLGAEIYALDTETGDVLWTDDFGDGSESAAAGVTVAGGMVFAGVGWDWAPIGAPPSGGLTAWALP